MDYIWIYTITTIFLLGDVTNGQSEVRVQLVVKKYVEKGGSVSLQCKHNVQSDYLHKVSWFKTGENKFFEYIHGRDPPFRNATLIGAEIDAQNSNQHQVTLRRVDFQAAGDYYCEVSTDFPIFTKGSNEEQLHVILSQSATPQITFRIRQTIYGEKLVANCTTSKAHPPPYITWMINGNLVEKKYTKIFQHRHYQGVKDDDDGSEYGGGGYSGGGSGGHRIKMYQQNSSFDNRFDAVTEKQHNSKYSISHKGEPPSKHQKNMEYKNNLVTLMHYHFDHNKTSVNSGGNNGNRNADEKLNSNLQPHHQDNDEVASNLNKYFGTHRYRNSKKFKRNSIKKLMKALHRPLASKNQLFIDVSLLEVNADGKIEVTCTATIPHYVEDDDDYADFKRTSVEIEFQHETTSLVPQRIDAAPLDGYHNQHQNHPDSSKVHVINTNIFNSHTNNNCNKQLNVNDLIVLGILLFYYYRYNVQL